MILFGLFVGILAFSAVPAQDETSLWRLYEKRDFFSLQREFAGSSLHEVPRTKFIRAQTEAAFGHFDGSSRMLRGLLEGRLDTSLERAARERLMLNERSMFRYRAALAAIRPLLQGSDTQVQNRAALLVQLQNVSPEVLHTSDALVSLPVDRFGALAANVSGRRLRMAIDTGANLSVLSRSAARAIEIPIRKAGYHVRLANNRVISADVAIGTISLASGFSISNVVFLVVPDSTLRISTKRALDGLIGLPELSQMGPIRFERSGTAILNAHKPQHSVRLIALVDGDPILDATLGDQAIPCRIDTGSNRTVFYGRMRERRHLTLAIGSQRIRLSSAVVLRSSAANQRYTHCSLGRDSLRRLEPYTLDLHRLYIGFD